MRLTVLEQRELRIAARAEEQAATLSHDPGMALVDLAVRMGARIVTWQLEPRA